MEVVDGHLRYRDGARLRTRHRGRDAGARCAAIDGRDRGLPGAGMSGADASGRSSRTTRASRRPHAAADCCATAHARMRRRIRPSAASAPACGADGRGTRSTCRCARHARGLAAAGRQARRGAGAIVAENREEQLLLELGRSASVRAPSALILIHRPMRSATCWTTRTRRIVIAEDQEQVDKILGLPCRSSRGSRRFYYVEARGLWHYEAPQAGAARCPG